MLSPLPYFEQVERGVRGATNWQIANRRWIDKPDEAEDPVRHGLDARGRLRVFEQGSLHVLLDYPGWTDEIVYYARQNELLTRYVVADDRLLACYHARRTDCCEETFTWENGKVVKSVERMWIEEDGEFMESEFQEILVYSVDAAGLLQEIRCQTLKNGLPSSEDLVFRRGPTRLKRHG